jgi:hypothetical protein
MLCFANDSQQASCLSKVKHFVRFLICLKKMGIDFAGFFFGFMVPRHFADDFPEQVFLTSANILLCRLQILLQS